MKAEIQHRLRDGVPPAKILRDEWRMKQDGTRNLEDCGMSRGVSYHDVKHQEEPPRQGGNYESIVQQAREGWVQRADLNGLDFPEDVAKDFPREKIRNYGQATVVLYNDYTISLLKKFGQVVVIDATHGLLDTNYSTVFMAIYDERGTGECAHFT